MYDIRNSLYNKLINIPADFYSNKNNGDLYSICIRDTSRIRETLSHSIRSIINEPLSIIVFLSLLFIINKNLTFIIITSIPFLWFLVFIIGKLIKNKATESSHQISKVAIAIADVIRGPKIIKSFLLGDILVDKFRTKNAIFRNIQLNKDRLEHLVSPTNDMIGVSIGIILIWIGGSDLINSKSLMGKEDFIRYIIFLFAMLQPARRLSNINAIIQSGLASVERVFSILNYDDEENTNVLSKNNLLFKSRIQIRELYYRYNNNSFNTLKDINIKINKNDTVSIVGENGSGKSTFLDILLGFNREYRGTITIDGQNIKNMNKNDIRNVISFVPQETILFNESIMENIRYGKPSASDDDIFKAAKYSNAFEFIDRLENGFNTILYDNGSNISGGERQLISITRAILKDSPILILDEPTSSIDNDLEQKIKYSLEKLFNNRTVIIIAHKISTIKGSDQIFVFDDGMVIQSGTHNELIKSNGLYKKLYSKEA